jgi:protoheme IX farnesyltransferase
MKIFISYLKTVAELTKLKITATVSFTTTLGFGLFSGKFSTSMILPIFGTFLIACASSALNQYQERNFDALMERTKNRPLPTNKISSKHALILAIILAVIGSVILYKSSNFVCLILGLTALVWYNAVYVNLKRKTAFAVIPGSVIGAIPPVIGWCAAGGTVWDFRILIVAFFYFLWQIPHFWLLLFKYADDYRKAGYPVLPDIFSERQIFNLTFIWLACAVITGLSFPYFKIINSISGTVFLTFISIFILLIFKILFKKINSLSAKKMFIFINIYMMAVLLIIIIDSTF